MKMLGTLLLGLACSLPLAAAAQWHWIGKDGRKVFSDQAPPPDIPAANILKQPGGQAGTRKRRFRIANRRSHAGGAGVSAPKISGKDKELEERKKKAEAAEAAKEEEEKSKVAKARAENCTRAKQAKQDFDSGIRIARTNAKGEREIMDDSARAAEVKRLQGILASDCKAS